MSGEELTQALRDAGCDDAATKEFMRLYAEGQTAKARKLLSQHRKELLDGIHAGEIEGSWALENAYEMGKTI